MQTVKIIVKVKHDTGTTKISTYATSLDEAKDKVCKAENCPLNAIIYAKVAPLTIYDIKSNVENKGSHYFTRKTLKFFGQKVSDFKVNRFGDDKFYFFAPFGRNCPEGISERIFNPFTNELESITNG
jgi:hypothetical protein